MEKPKQGARRRWTSSERERWVKEYRASELTQEQFAAQAQLKVETLRGWIYKRAAVAAGTGGFAAVQLVGDRAPRGCGSVTVRWPHGVEVELADGPRRDRRRALGAESGGAMLAIGAAARIYLATEVALHLIVDNYATHKHPAVREWLEKHPRMHVHFTPTGSSWLNLVERFFRQLTDEVVREGSFGSVAELVTAINVHLAHHNLMPKPYRWKAEGAAILEKIQRARLAQAKTEL